MTRCESIQTDLVEVAYGNLALDQAPELEAHLTRCGACRHELVELQQTVKLVNASMPAKPEVLDAWARVAPVLDRSVATRPIARLRVWLKTLALPRFSWMGSATAAAAMLIIGVAIGRWLPPREAIGPAQVPLAVVDRGPQVTPDTRQDYAALLDQSTPLLLAIANRASEAPFKTQVSFEPDLERQLAADLADRARHLIPELRDAGLGREVKLASSLELVFLQLANLPEDDYAGSIDLVQSMIEQRALLFALAAEEMRRQAALNTKQRI